MAEKTAVDWFWNEVGGMTLARDADFFAQKLKQAKQMENDRIEELERKIEDLENMLRELGEQQ